MTRPTSTRVLWFLVCLAFTAPASATPILWTFTGPASGTLVQASFPPGHETLLSFTNEPLRLEATFDPSANLCGAGSSSGVYRGSNASATFMGYTYPMAAYFESNAPLGSCAPWGGDPLFRFFVTGGPATRIDPDGTLVLFNNLIGVGTFGIFMNANPGSMPDYLRPSYAGAVYFHGAYDSLSWNPVVTARAVPEPAAMTLVAVSLFATAIRRRRARAHSGRPEYRRKR